MIINKSGIIIRIAVENLRIMGRATQGVRLINLRDQDEIAAVAKVSVEEVEEIEEETTDDQMLDNQEDISKENREIDPENN
jgi:DNA gyrase subunit A